jgi:DNA polymerase
VSSENIPAADRIAPDRDAVLALADGLRTCLRLHQQLGLDSYPYTPGLREFLRPRRPRAGAGENRRRTAASAPSRPARPAVPGPTKAEINAASNDQLSSVRQDIERCTLCPLAHSRLGMVPGSGTAPAALLIIGDHSRQHGNFSAEILFGGEEDVMLWNMMRAIGLGPADVYVTNTVKCCPVDAGQSLAASEQACCGYLQREIALVRPRVILAMGEAAAKAVLGTGDPVFRLRGRLHPARLSALTGTPIPVMVTFHPRYLLAQAAMKKAAWQDLQIVQHHLHPSTGEAA